MQIFANFKKETLGKYPVAKNNGDVFQFFMRQNITVSHYLIGIKKYNIIYAPLMLRSNLFLPGVTV